MLRKKHPGRSEFRLGKCTHVVMAGLQLAGIYPVASRQFPLPFLPLLFFIPSTLTPKRRFFRPICQSKRFCWCAALLTLWSLLTWSVSYASKNFAPRWLACVTWNRVKFSRRIPKSRRKQKMCAPFVSQQFARRTQIWLWNYLEIILKYKLWFLASSYYLMSLGRRPNWLAFIHSITTNRYQNLWLWYYQ
jgi:hypothetical protein